MSSWRKLMSPVSQKYYPQDSASSLAQSNFGKSSSLLNKCQESIQTTASTYNDKLKTLHNQMSKLKGELSKYSTTRERNNNRPSKVLAKINKTLGDDISPLSPPPKVQRINQTQEIADMSHSPMKIITCEELEDDEEEQVQEEVKISPKRDRHHLKSDFTQHRQKMSIASSNSNKYIMQDALSPKSLMDDPFAETLDNNNKSNGKVIFVDDIQEKETTRYPKKSHAKTLSILKNGAITTRDEEDKFRTMKSTTRLRSKENNEEGSIDLKKTLSEYCSQINELKQIALQSQSQIAHLTEELAKEKQESSKLRDEVHRSSIFIKAHMNQDSDKEWDLPQPSQKVNRSRPKSTLQQIVNPNSATEQRRRRQKDDPQFFYTAALDTTKERYAEESTDLSNVKHHHHRHRNCDTGIQCEMKDENSQRIIYQNEEKIKAQEARITQLEAEVEKFKGHKNEMIATFQQIVSILSVSSEQLKDKSPAPKAQEIKSDFSNFYNTINAKLSTIASTTQQAPPSTFKASKMNGFASYLAASKMSRHNKTEISDNLMYSPSVDDDLMDSKYASAIRPFKGTLIFNGKASGISTTSP